MLCDCGGQGTATFKAGHFLLAVRHFSDALERCRGSDANVHYNLGLSKAQLGDVHNAVKVGGGAGSSGGGAGSRVSRGCDS